MICSWSRSSQVRAERNAGHVRNMRRWDVGTSVNVQCAHGLCAFIVAFDNPRKTSRANVLECYSHGWPIGILVHTCPSPHTTTATLTSAGEIHAQASPCVVFYSQGHDSSVSSRMRGAAPLCPHAASQRADNSSSSPPLPSPPPPSPPPLRTPSPHVQKHKKPSVCAHVHTSSRDAYISVGTRGCGKLGFSVCVSAA